VTRKDGSTYHATPLAGDKGFPDLSMVHKTRPNLLIVELKSDTGRLDEAQKEWWVDLERASVPGGPFRYYIWNPDHWRDGTIKTILTEGWKV